MGASPVPAGADVSNGPEPVAVEADGGESVPEEPVPEEDDDVGGAAGTVPLPASGSGESEDPGGVGPGGLVIGGCPFVSLVR